MSHYAMNAYAQTAVTGAVECASPHQLVLMLYDGLLKQIRLAEAYLGHGAVSQKAHCITKAIRILDQGLRAHLDEEAGGQIAIQLRDLYDYCERTLMLANARNEAALLVEVRDLIELLRSAWAEIGPDAGRTSAVVEAAR